MSIAEPKTVSFRVAYLREQWRRLGAEAAGRPVAVYGGGRHTSFLLDEAVRSVEGGPSVSVVLDDSARGAREIAGVPVRRPAEVDPASVAMVIVSSDSIEGVLAEKARQWVQVLPRGRAPIVARLYEGVASGPFRGHSDLVVAGSGGESGPEAFTGVTRIGPSRPRSPGEPLALPPAELRAGYSPSDRDYLESGRALNRAMRALLAGHGALIAGHAPGAAVRDILEWGCSTGRVLRHWEDAAGPGGARVWGCDIDAPAVQWAAGNLAPPFAFFQSGVHPSLPLEDRSFDLVYGISVMTHIAEAADAWLMELRRITRPGGWVFLSINDEHVWERCADDPGHTLARLCPKLNFSHPMTDDCISHGRGVHAQTFWHSRGVRRRWPAFFDVVEIRPGLVDGVQAGVLLRRPAGG